MLALWYLACSIFKGKTLDQEEIDLIQREIGDEWPTWGKNSIINRIMSEKIFPEISKGKTSDGHILVDIIFPSLANKPFIMEIYACNADCYDVFRPLFDLIFKILHPRYGKFREHPKTNFGDPDTLKDFDICGCESAILSTSIQCVRNVKGFRFVPTTSLEDLKFLEDIAKSFFKRLDKEFKGMYHPIDTMGEETVKWLYENKSIYGDRRAKFWPEGRGAYVSEDKNLVIWVNMSNHYTVISLQNGGDFTEVYGRLIKVMTLLAGHIEFNCDEQLGYLTVSPLMVGCGLYVNCHVNLPNLTKDSRQIRQFAQNNEIQAYQCQKITSTDSRVWNISSKRGMGYTEIEIMRSFCSWLKALLNIERQ